MPVRFRRVARTVVAALALARSLTLAQSQAPSSAVPDFTLALVTPSGPFKLGDPIHLKMKMKNTTDHMVYGWVPPGPGWGDEIVGVDMTDSTGWPVTKWWKLRMQANGGKRPLDTGPGSSRSDHIPPRQTIEREVRLEKVFKITAPGHYTVRIGRWDPNSHTSVKSEPIGIDIFPAS